MSKPADRYINLRIKTLPDGRQVYAPAIPLSPIDIPAIDIIITAGEEDRMDIIANNVYGTPIDWWRLALLNNLVTGTLYIPSNTQFIIPNK